MAFSDSFNLKKKGRLTDSRERTVNSTKRRDFLKRPPIRLRNNQNDYITSLPYRRLLHIWGLTIASIEIVFN